MKIKFINSIDAIKAMIECYEKNYNNIFFITQKNILNTEIPSQFIKQHKVYICRDGEQSKSLEEYQNLIQYLVNNQCNKNSLIIAVGGGSITDLSGFTASTYMRGIPYINIPTTLLGMVDASIGGKTALNIDGKRNLIGTFKDANEVIIHNQFLQSLPFEEMINGYAEIIKYALIMDSKLFEKIEKNIESLLNNIDLNLINTIIQTCINHKMKIVTQDQYDRGIRNTLNFGHTIGHALESYYEFKLSHGKAVLYGMKVASYLSLHKHNITESKYRRIINIINKLGVDNLHNLDMNKILNFIKIDKKNINNQLNYILLKDIGSAYIEQNYNKDNLIEGLQTL